MPPGSRTAAAALTAFFLLISGCGDDNGGFKPGGSFRVPTSPEDVLHNFEAAYNEMDYGHFWPLLHDDYLFVFDPDDVDNYPDLIPGSGIWGRSEELQAHMNMLDTTCTPQDPGNKIERLYLKLALSGELEPSGLVDFPAETQEGFVTFDLGVYTIGEIDYAVRSRPKFYFAHMDSSVTEADTTFYWGIYRIEDAPFEISHIEARGSGSISADREGTHDALWPEDESARTPPTGQRSWGAVKSLYAGS